MTISLQEFRKEFIETIRVLATTERNYELSAFVEVAVRTLVDAGELADFQACHFRGVGARQRALWVDGFEFDEVDDSLRLVVADWRGSETMETLTQTDSNAILGRAKAFADDASGGRLHEELEYAIEAYGLAKQMSERREAIARYRIYLISDRALSARVRDWPEGTVGSTPVEFHIWDIARLYRAWESKTGRDELDINLAQYQPGGIPCLAASGGTDQYESYLCVITGETLARLYEEYGSRLLEGNVRSFLSVRGKVNKGIRATILSEPEMFFAYNNGIAVTATDVEISDSPEGRRLLRAKDLQIVNGGQTTASLAAALRKDKATLAEVFVPMKLSVVPPDRASDVIPRIAKYANSQNKVSDADFFSNHEFHRRMEEISRRIWAPAVGGAQHETHWFYERARGQFVNEQAEMTRNERARFLAQNPREQVITKTDLAKVENAWGLLPHVVSRGAQKNFLEFAERSSKGWDDGNTEFNEEYFRRIVVRAILFRATEGLVSRQPWYQGGYRANIVAYAVAKLASMVQSVESQPEMDYQGIWGKQALSPALERQLAAIARSVFQVIIYPPDGFQNVTEWCKKEQCWKRIVELQIELLPAVRSELVERALGRRQRGEARMQQKVDNRIDAQIKAVELGPEFWGKLGNWARLNAAVSEEEDRLLSLVERMPDIVPNERQSERLLRFMARMKDEGFRAE